ncbi:ankyrin repeat domain-containing protein [Limibacter armeniacum]|uniref:ankyrin repeat domain-containing protein n=1 Tax=Limibacter armeniacum TaxID=466084 RepID=UPI002FE60C3E
MSIFKRLFKTDKEPVPEEVVMKAIYDNDIDSFKNCIKQYTPEQIKLNSNPDEFSALHIACSEGRSEIAELILSEPISETPNLSRINNFYPIHACAMNGHKRTVELLIQKGADINVQTDPQLYSPLHSASFAGHLETVKLLVKNGANTNLKNYRDELPIDTAERQNETEVVEFLKKA